MSEPEISDDFKQLGDNLVELLRAAWARPERREIQSELENGLNELGAALNQAAVEFSTSETGQKLKEEVKDLKSRVQSGEVEGTIRKDLKAALTAVNRELEALAKKIRSTESTER